MSFRGKESGRGPRYSGEAGQFELIPDFSNSLKRNLRDLYLDHQHNQKLGTKKLAGQFSVELLREAGWAKEQTFWLSHRSSKIQTRAEYRDLVKSLISTEQKLRQVSPELDALLLRAAQSFQSHSPANSAPAPQECADHLRDMLTLLNETSRFLDELPPANKLSSEKLAIANELVVRVGRVFEEYELAYSATYDPDISSPSVAIRILMLVGRESGLRYSKKSWRDRIADAKRT